VTVAALRHQVRSRLARHPDLYASARRVGRLVGVRPSARDPRARLVPSPVFVICSVRSGSTLLRVVLNSHPEICAPHELHLRFLRVHLDRPFAATAMSELGLDPDELEHMLWDRILHRQLVLTGKRIIVEKTPHNCTYLDRLRGCWPNARFIILLRHPASVVASLMETRPDRELDSTVREALTYLNGVEEARQTLPGLVVRYEDLIDDPAGVTRNLCAYLGVRWYAAMQNYGAAKHGVFRGGIGDWSTKIKSGQIQAARPLPTPAEIPPEIEPIARRWGYVSDGD
jgi:hypothetical protein